MTRLGMGLVGPGFVGVHHLDAVRRLGFVDVVGIAASTDGSARLKATALGGVRSFPSHRALIADPGVHVVHVATPNHLHAPVVLDALAQGKHVICEKPLAPTAAEARHLLDCARDAGVVHAVVFNYRGNPLVQHAREIVAAGEIGPVHQVFGAYLQDWLLKPTDFSWRLEPEKSGRSCAVGDIGSHWCDLVEHVTGDSIEAVLADLTTVVSTRLRPEGSRLAFDKGRADERSRAVTVHSEDMATVLLRFARGAKGCVSIGQVCAGHKNDLWFEANGATGSLRWHQERQNELWIGRRDGPNLVLPKDPSLLGETARRYAHLPAGHHESWADALFNVLRDIYLVIAGGARSSARPPAFATFEDGYRAALTVEAILDSHENGGVWTSIGAVEKAQSRP